MFGDDVLILAFPLQDLIVFAILFLLCRIAWHYTKKRYNWKF